MSLLEVVGLRVETAAQPPVALVESMSFALEAGEMVCIVGESGSGKTVTGLTVLGLTAEAGLRVSGTVRYLDHDLAALPAAKVRRLRGRGLALVPQEPSSALDPLFTIGAQVAEAVRRADGRSTGTRERVVELLRLARVPDPESRMRQYPHELSGGLCQRVLVAIALAGRPALIVADEPTSALDATVQSEILTLLDDVRASSHAAMILITHDMAVAARAARILVMYAGSLAEAGPAREVLSAPAHPYTAGLIRSSPPLESVVAAHRPGRRLSAMAGSVPSPTDRPEGCAFRTRCPLASDRCTQPQTLKPVPGSPERETACWRVSDGLLAPGIGALSAHPIGAAT